ncbi:MAG: hypothetical protein RSA89_03605 [Raoultibacter sp.]
MADGETLKETSAQAVAASGKSGEAPGAVPKVRTSMVIKLAGALVGTLIGSGFASGQEVMQFFTSYGLAGIIGCLVAMALFGLLGAVFMSYGFRHKTADDFSAFRYFCGKYLGTFLEWFTILFCFLVGIIMISGAGATLNQYFGVPQLVGSGIMSVIVLISALAGLRRLVSILGYIGPVAILFLVLISLYALFTNFSGITGAEAAIEANGENVVRGIGTSNAWFLVGAVMYVAYNILAGVPFLSQLGTQAASKKEAVFGGLFGGVLLGGCALLLNLAMLSTYAQTSQYEVPALHFATMISPAVGFVFVFVLLAMIYNTAVPMVWTVASQFVDEKTDLRRHRFLVALLTVIIFFGGQLPFGMLVNLIYPFVGYFGIAFMVVILVQYMRWHFDKKKGIVR